MHSGFVALPPHIDQHDAAQRRLTAQRRLAARARRLHTLRRRAAGGAVAVFLAAWVAIYVPAQRDAASVSAADVTAIPALTTDSGSDTGDSGSRSGFATQSPADPTGSADDSTSAVPAAPVTSGQS